MCQTTKEKVFALLQRNLGTFISGEEIAKQLSLSRTAVWKAIAQLKEEGCSIDAAASRGYCLKKCGDRLSAELIRPLLQQDNWEELVVLDEVDSTNLYVKRQASKGRRGNYAVLADCQTGGRGRMGRAFFSPPGVGLYLTAAFSLPLALHNAGLITVYASVAVAGALQKVLGIECDIKWVNDLYCGGKKVCGILTEGAMDFESGRFDYFLIGIGVNIRTPPGGFAGNARGIAGAVCDFAAGEIPDMLRCRIAAEILNGLRRLENEIEGRAYLAEYRRRSMLLGKKITVYPIVGGSESYEAEAVEIDDDGRLIVSCPDGSVKALNSGEVSVKPTAS